MSSHQCRACLVYCMDFRLHKQLSDFLVNHGLDGDGADIIRVAGAAKSLAQPKESRDRDFLMEQLHISHALHGVNQFYLINHEDCGAYGLENVADSEEELAIHRDDLRTAREMLQKSLPDAEVFSYFMWLNGKADRID